MSSEHDPTPAVKLRAERLESFRAVARLFEGAGTAEDARATLAWLEGAVEGSSFGVLRYNDSTAELSLSTVYPPDVRVMKEGQRLLVQMIKQAIEIGRKAR